jgi:hypothetical protein
MANTGAADAVCPHNCFDYMDCQLKCWQPRHVLAPVATWATGLWIDLVKHYPAQLPWINSTMNGQVLFELPHVTCYMEHTITFDDRGALEGAFHPRTVIITLVKGYRAKKDAPIVDTWDSDWFDPGVDGPRIYKHAYPRAREQEGTCD